MVERLKDIDIEVEYSEELKKLIAEKGYDRVFGARPIERYIGTEIEDMLSDEILKNIEKNDKILIDVTEDKPSYKKV